MASIWTTVGLYTAIGLAGIAAGMFYKDYFGESTALKKPELHLSVSGGNVFVPTDQPTWAGIGVEARVWNTGSPSVVTEWSMTITPNGETPVKAQLTAMPNVLAAAGPFNSSVLLAANSLEIKTRDTPVKLQAVPGVLLFYVDLPRDVVRAADTKWEIVAKDIYEKEVRTTHLVGEWVQR
jgi:hypothetical protein